MSEFALVVDEKNYDYFTPGFAVDQSTGETIETILVELPVGSRIYTPARQHEYMKRKQWEETQRRRVSNNGSFGKFIFLKNIPYPDLSPETLTRLVKPLQACFSTKSVQNTSTREMTAHLFPQAITLFVAS